MIKFELNSAYIELKGLLKATGLCESGGQAAQAITEGLVKVDGQVETRKACKIRSGQSVEFNGTTITIQ